MAAKKNSPATSGDENLPDLNDGEKIIISDVRTIQKQNVPGANSQTVNKIIDLQAETEDETDETDDDAEYSDNSLAALMMNGTDTIQNEFCSVAVRREPDSMGDSFLEPSASRKALPTLKNIEVTADREDIHERVRNLYGGGHYFFQIYYNGRLSASWKECLGDSPEAKAKAKAELDARNQPQQLQTVQQSQPAQQTVVNPFDQLIDGLKKQKDLKELLFGDEMRELDKLRDSKRQTPTGEPQSELGMILQHADSPNFDKLLERFLPGEKTSIVRDIVDGAKEILPLGSEIGSFVGSLWTGISGAAGETTTETDIEQMMRQPPPGQQTQNAPAQPPPPRSNFQRRKPPANNQPGEKPKREKKAE